MQYRNKIIALFTAVCLLVGMMVVPSAAADDTELYSYNGVVLPALPEWDKSAYPFGFLVQLSSDDIRFVCTERLSFGDFGAGGVGNWSIQFFATGSDSISCQYAKLSNGVWGALSSNVGLWTSTSISNVFWANFDVLDRDGTVYLAASDPISLGGSSLPDEASILDVLVSIYELDDTILYMLGQLWLRLRYIEVNTLSILDAISSLAPSEQETALREAFKDTSSAVVEEMSGGGFTVTRDDAKSFFESGRQVSTTFDTGTTVGDFFSVFTDYVFTGWFSEETRANLDSVNAVSTLDAEDVDPYNHDAYEKNMEAFQEFLGRSESVND